MNIQLQILQGYKRYKIEFFALIIALVIAVSTAVFFSVNAQSAHSDSSAGTVVVSLDTTEQTQILVVDVSGAVTHPGIYEVPPSTRLVTVVEMAGGMTDLADTGYFYRNFNLARPLQDGEKIYIPYHSEIETGVFVEAPRILRYLSHAETDTQVPSTTSSRIVIPSPEGQPGSTTSSRISVSINTASPAELDSLPGVGAKTVEKIVAGRPYSSLEELVQKKVLGQKLFDTLQPQLSL